MLMDLAWGGNADIVTIKCSQAPSATRFMTLLGWVHIQKWNTDEKHRKKWEKMEIKHQALGNKFYDIMKSGYMKKWKNLLLAALLIFYHLLSHPDFQIISGDYFNWHRCPESTNYSWSKDSYSRVKTQIIILFSLIYS